jgi:hypothetical protein
MTLDEAYNNALHNIGQTLYEAKCNSDGTIRYTEHRINKVEVGVTLYEGKQVVSLTYYTTDGHVLYLVANGEPSKARVYHSKADAKNAILKRVVESE